MVQKVSLRLWVVAHIWICTRMVLFHMHPAALCGGTHELAAGVPVPPALWVLGTCGWAHGFVLGCPREWGPVPWGEGVAWTQLWGSFCISLWDGTGF